MTSLLDKLDLIECFQRPRKYMQIGEILENQREIFAAINIEPPASL